LVARGSAAFWPKRFNGGNVLLANYARAVNAVVAPAGYTGSNFVLNSRGQVLPEMNAVALISSAHWFRVEV
jgi:hypothetical protein